MSMQRQRYKKIQDAWRRLGHPGLVQVAANLHEILVRRNCSLHSARQIQSPQSQLADNHVGHIHLQVKVKSWLEI